VRDAAGRPTASAVRGHGTSHHARDRDARHRDALAAVLHGCVADPEAVRTDELTRRALAHDASHVLLHPAAVVAPRDAAEVAALLRATADVGVPLTFRSGGTSLSGQAGTDGVLADVRRHFRRVDVLDGGARVRVQPGVTVRRVNAELARYGRRLGPDPASEAAATLGGVLANNSSGMACGTAENSYRTLESLVAVLPSGTVLDTGAPDADARLRALEPDLHEGLLRLRGRVLASADAMATIARQFAMKNTMGYGLNALVDFESPAEIFAHLLIGSEGTLAFVAEATLRTVPLRPHAATALLVFDSLAAATRALPELVATGAATLELMDARSLRVGQALPGTPAAVAALEVREHAALLVEYQAAEAAERDDLAAAAAPALAALRLAAPVVLSADAAERAGLWSLRKGLYTAVAGARRSGTTALLEDVVVPVGALADTCTELGELCTAHGYDDAVIFGHAKDGNIHFMLTDRFESDEQLGRYEAFTEGLVDLVLGHGGSLKAEHGTGRVMAPFVRRQYGDELYDVMREIKALADPRGLLNPGVLLTDDPRAHLRHIKLAPAVEAEVDRCVECGYCEPVCPSRDLTLTPRQRIAVRRELHAARAAGDVALAHELERDYDYAGLETCAVDGMCGTACPVHIDTGLLVKRLRAEAAPAPVAAAWAGAARHWAAGTAVAGRALSAVTALPAPLRPALHGANRAARAVAGEDLVPLWSAELPRGGASRRRPAPAPDGPAPVAVYLPACVNAMFGPADARDGHPGAGVQAAVERLCAAAGITLLVPEGVDALCCGTPWSSKGMTRGKDAMRDRVLPVLRAATRRVAEAVPTGAPGDAPGAGPASVRVPVICDASSCTEGFRAMVAGDPTLDVEVIDAVAFVDAYLLPRLTATGGTLAPDPADARGTGPAGTPRLASLTVHPTCSSTQLGLNPALLRVAAHVAVDVDVPLDAGCCAFAGDRGLLHPELTASATRVEAAQARERDAVAHASCNRTCELGLTRATGRTYRHVLELLAERLEPARPIAGTPHPKEQ
jgi:D-lactate dehydrogenase